MKQIFALILMTAMLLTLAGCANADPAAEAGPDQADPQAKIFALVEANYDAIVTACEEKDMHTLCAIAGIEEVRIVEGCIVVYCMGADSQDYGFYYSSGGTAAAVDRNLHILCSAEEMTPKGAGLEYTAEGNICYTQQIKDKLFFYSTTY